MVATIVAVMAAYVAGSALVFFAVDRYCDSRESTVARRCLSRESLERMRREDLAADAVTDLERRLEARFEAIKAAHAKQETARIDLETRVGRLEGKAVRALG